jgi:hypothetical protein
MLKTAISAGKYMEAAELQIIARTRGTLIS